MKYVNYDNETGKILGWYDSIVNKGKIPDGAIEISDTTWQAAINNNCNHYNTETGECSVVDFRTDDEIIANRQSDAKATRNMAIDSDIEYNGVLWQVSDDASDIRNTIGDADLIGALETDSVSFRLSDNSWRDTTLAELRELLTEYITRKRSVWASFAEWDEGDKSEDFEVTL